MPGPMSLPQGNTSALTYDDLQDVVCDYHFNCDGRVFNKDGDEIMHSIITYREWLFKRNRLTTGKTR